MDEHRFQVAQIQYWPQNGPFPLGFLLGRKKLGTPSGEQQHWVPREAPFPGILTLVGGFERLLNDVMGCPATHVRPDREVGFAVLPLLLQTRLWGDSHPQARSAGWPCGCLRSTHRKHDGIVPLEMLFLLSALE